MDEDREELRTEEIKRIVEDLHDRGANDAETFHELCRCPVCRSAGSRETSMSWWLSCAGCGTAQWLVLTDEVHTKQHEGSILMSEVEEEMSGKEIERFLYLQAEEGKTAEEAFKALFKVIGVELPKFAK